MDLRFSDEDEAFRAEARAWLTEQLSDHFAVVRGRGGPGDEHALFDERLAWEHHLGAFGWTCVGWPKEHGGRGLSLHQQVIWYEEYARAGGPGRLGHIGENAVDWLRRDELVLAERTPYEEIFRDDITCVRHYLPLDEAREMLGIRDVGPAFESAEASEIFTEGQYKG